MAASGLDEDLSIYNSDTGIVKNLDLSYLGNQLLERFPKTIRRIRITMETPAQLKDKGNIAGIPEFHILFRQAMRRISSLAYFHQGEPLRADYAGLAEPFRRITITENATRRHDWERYSRRQQQSLNIGGLIGTFIYEGELDEFMPFLILGEHVHMGKNTVFGLGKYRISVC